MAQQNSTFCDLNEVELPDQAQSIAVQRYRDGMVTEAQDEAAEEFPVALVYNGISHAVMMVTPGDLEPFALGFTLSEGIAASPAEVHAIEVTAHPTGAEIQITLAQPAFLALKEHRRAMVGRTGCGICGTESLAMLDLQPEKIRSAACHVEHAALCRILEELPRYQTLTQATGCAHAAAWALADGSVVRVFEDVGRHNALDKLLGWMVREQVETRSGLVFMTSRASYELVRKAARLDVPVLATISAPTALAIRIASASGLRLLSFCRRNGFVAYPVQEE